ncbi:hypothetical protein D3C87_1369320 [compost metagenome]
MIFAKAGPSPASAMILRSAIMETSFNVNVAQPCWRAGKWPARLQSRCIAALRPVMAVMSLGANVANSTSNFIGGMYVA